MPATSLVRRSPLRGSWYPAEPDALSAAIDGFLKDVPARPLDGRLVALIVPHAGYRFSGQTAAYGYRHVAGRHYDGVVVVGPSHFEWIGDFAMTSQAAYETPFGTVPVNEVLSAKLSALLPINRVTEPWAASRAIRWEHSLEVQLPFLQRVLGDFSFVPMLMNAEELEPCVRLGHALAVLMREHEILLIASSDLNHLPSYSAVRQRDGEIVAALQQFELESLAGMLLSSSYTVCGRAPLLAVGMAARLAGADRVQLLQHTNSGDVTGRTTEGTYTVGYLSAAYVQTGAPLA